MAKRIILLVNTGSPHTASESDVRSYLQEFLSDGDIISLPYLIRQLLVRGIIVPRRTEYSAGRYRQMVEMCGGIMPLTAEMERLAEQTALQTNLPTLYAPRYAQTSREAWGDRIARLAMTDDVEILLLPLYPQYTRSNAGSAISYFSNLPKPSGGYYKTYVLSSWGTHPLYVQLLSELIQDCIDTSDPSYHYVATFHSIPDSHHKYDRAHGWDYHAQCLVTLRAVMKWLEIPTERQHLAFHSAMGHGKWSQPTLTSRLRELATQGVDRLVLFSPSFVTECLETKLDLELEAREFFLAAGGAEFIYAPCLSTHPDTAKLIATLLDTVSSLN